MIVDSPYNFLGLALSPKIGIIAGILSAGVMLAVVSVCEPISTISVIQVLSKISLMIIPGPFGPTYGRSNLIIGLIMHLILGGIFGLLYAMCQKSIPNRGLIGVGIFYGFVLWVVSSLLIGLLLTETVRVFLRSWAWLVANLVYGLCLAGMSIWSLKKQTSSSGTIVPVD